ncbi:uncharacterized protein LOC114932351 [Nylanderia fulva]|uniref:uncharacterized protein LOC114932351 n=1 Tax=Nylanderia fulva TaxID=613905 RepID=UPI0010FB69A0|nr:uncharacterized protein LOC114932351 [Nylanderia fulva]
MSLYACYFMCQYGFSFRVCKCTTDFATAISILLLVIQTGPYMLYYHGLKIICMIFSICLSISTALKIARYEKDTSLGLKNSESKCYNDNKKWFNLYLKIFIVLFILMGIKWLMMTAHVLSAMVSIYNWYVIYLLDIMQNLCTFIIFVWRK